MPEDAAVDLIGALIENMKGAEGGWESLSIVITIDNGTFRGTSGYAYSPGGPIWAVASRPSGVKDAVHAYLASTFDPGVALPVKLLVQFDSTSGEYEITFEDTDTSRWKVTPANIDVIREELRPRFEGVGEEPRVGEQPDP